MKTTNLFQKLLSILLVVSMVLQFAPMATQAEEQTLSGTCGDNATWFFDETTGTLTISGTGTIADYVTVWSDYAQNVKAILIEDGITEIGCEAFSRFGLLTDVTIPESVTSIRNYAFQYCVSLTSITIPDSVTSLSHGVFRGCTALKTVDNSANLQYMQESVFEGCSSLKNITIPAGVTLLDCYVFRDCTAPVSITFMGDAPWINYNTPAFLDAVATCYYPADNTTWTTDVMQQYGGTITWEPYSAPATTYTITLENPEPSRGTITADKTAAAAGETVTLTVVPADYYELNSITVTDADGDSVTVENNAFTMPASNVTVTVKFKQVNTVPDEPAANACGDSVIWAYDVSTKTLTISGTGPMWVYQDPTTLPWYSSYANLIEKIVVGEGVTEISPGLNFFNNALKEFSLPSTLTTYGFCAVFACENLETISVAEGNQNYITDESGVLYDTAKTQLYLTPAATLSGDYIVPETVTRVHGFSFANCENLTSVKFQGDAPQFDSAVFQGLTLTAYYPADNSTWTSDVMQQYGGTITWTVYEADSGEEDTADNKCGDNATWAYDETTQTLTISGNGAIYNYFDSEEGTSNTPWKEYSMGMQALVISEGITRIGDAAFFDFRVIPSITLPESVTSIGDYAFYFCMAIPSLVIPEGVTEIGNYAFGICQSLTEITIPASVTSIGEIPFQACSALTAITVDGDNPNYSSDENGILFNKDKTKLICVPGNTSGTYTVPDTVTAIDMGALFMCTGLTGVTVPASVTTIGEGAFSFSGITELTFEGDAPTFGEGVFYNLTATAYYPANNTTWTSDVMQNYGGTITWVASESICDGTNHNYVNGICSCGAACAHTGGTATCAELAACDLCGMSYGSVDKTNHDSSLAYVNGFCVNGCYEPATDSNSDSYYEIGNAGQLYWFADYVNSKMLIIDGGTANDTEDDVYSTSANAVLTANIVVNEGTMTADSTGVREWTPIGSSTQYKGYFDGQNKTVSGLYFNDVTKDYVGLFGMNYGDVRNVGVVNSYICGNENVGGVAGYCLWSINDCYNTGYVTGNKCVGGVTGGANNNVIACYNTGTVTGDTMVGGIAGVANSSNFLVCYNTGTISGSKQIGGLLGRSATQQSGFFECYNAGAVQGTDASDGLVGGIAGEIIGSVSHCHNVGTITNGSGIIGYNSNNAIYGYGNISNSYYLSDTENDPISGTTAKTAAQFASGEIAFLLSDDSSQHAFGQTIGTDDYPVLDGAQVYYGCTSCADDAVMVYTNDSTAGAEKPGHTPEEGSYTDNGDGTHSYTCAVCEATDSEDHSGGTQTCKGYQCESCGAWYGEAAADAHSWNDGEVTTDPTCSAVGVKTYTCQHDTSHTYTEEVAINADAHSWNDGEIKTDPTCSKAGVKTYTCNHDASHTKTEEVAIDADTHSWNEGEVTTDPTCSKAGVKTYTCKHNVSHTKTEEVAIETNAHSWNEGEVTTAATCTATGVKTFTCGNDNSHTYTEEVSALGHDEVNHAAQAATCTAIGWDAYVTCSRCDYSTYKEIAATGEHTYVDGICSGCQLPDGLVYTISNGEVTITDYTGTASTLTVPGTIEGYPVTVIGDYSFQFCNTLTRITLSEGIVQIGRLAFDLCENLTQVILPETVTSIQDYAFQGCSSLATIRIPASVSYISFDAFNWCTKLDGVWVDENNATYSSDEDGVLYNKDKTTLLLLPPMSGAYRIPDGVTYLGSYAFFLPGATSVTIPGSVTGFNQIAFWRCQVPEIIFEGNAPAFPCDANGVPYENHFYDVTVTIQYPVNDTTWTDIINQNYGGTITWIPYGDCEHSWGTGTETTPASCTTDGVKNYTCTKCAETKTEAIPAKGHDYVGTVTTDPTCTAKGVMTFTCQNDASHTYTEELAATGHSLTQVAAQAATCEAIGWDAYEKCDLCDYTTYKEIAALGHSEVAVAGKAATCMETGLTEGKKCSVCGTVTVAQEVIPVADHSYVNNRCSVCGAGDPEFACGENAFWYLDDATGVLTIFGTGTMTDYTVNDVYVWYPYRSAIKQVVIEEGITNIANAAFNRCSNVTSVTIPNSVTIIKGSAFSGCTSLTTITIPKGVAAMEGSLFNATGLSKIVFEGNAPAMDSQLFVGVTANAYYPADDATWTEEVRQNYGGTITWIPYPEEEVTVEDVKDQIGNLGEDATEEEITDIVENLQSVPTEDLKDAMENDSAFTEQLDKLEEKVKETITVDTEITTDIANQFESAQVDYALLNDLTEDTTEVTLVVDKVKNSASTIPEGYSKDAKFFSLTLDGVSNTATLQIPVKITLTAHSASYAGKVVIIHYKNDGTQEIIEPAVDGQNLTFFLTGFSDFALTEVCSHGSVTYTDNCNGTCTGVCDGCGKAVDENVGHTYSTWTQTMAPTCTEVGEQSRSCTNCGNVEKQSVAALGHTEQTIPGTNATCTETGLTEGVTCATCGTVITAQTVIPAKNHSYSSGLCTDCGVKDPSWIWGDSDGDGVITSTDARLVLQYSVKLITVDALNGNASDVDGDGTITSTDARLILQYSVKLISNFPVES